MRRLALCFSFLVLLRPVEPFPVPQHAPSNPNQAFLEKLSAAAIERARLTVRYDPAYVRIPYPNGDVPSGTGVCTDEVVRSYRALGIDLQKEIHEDMERNFSIYANQSRWL